jgi:hypothetical protein
MNQILLQAVLAIGSWLGLALGWLQGYRGKRRIKQPLAGIITNVGALVLLVPWVGNGHVQLCEANTPRPLCARSIVPFSTMTKGTSYRTNSACWHLK